MWLAMRGDVRCPCTNGPQSVFVALQLDGRPEFDQRWGGLQELYGKIIMPDRLRKVLNATPGGLEHWCLGRSRGSMTDAEYAAFVAEVAIELERCCLRTEERPVTTRFCSFKGCVQTLLCWKMFQLPAKEVLQTSVKQQRETSLKRIVRARVFGRAADALRVGGCVYIATAEKSHLQKQPKIGGATVVETFLFLLGLHPVGEVKNPDHAMPHSPRVVDNFKSPFQKLFCRRNF